MHQKKTIKGRKRPDTEKEKISKSMKKLHEERRLRTWESPRQGKESWPEKWFTKIIENEFEDKNCVREMKFERYWLDFAWPEKQLCIEIDGSQHEYEHLKASDKRKDKMLTDAGWKVLRLKWLDCYNEPHIMIDIAKNFIDTGEIISYENRWIPSKIQRQQELEKQKKIKEIKKQELIEYRINIINKAEKKFGWISKISLQLGISHTQLRRFMKKYNL